MRRQDKIWLESHKKQKKLSNIPKSEPNRLPNLGPTGTHQKHSVINRLEWRVFYKEKHLCFHDWSLRLMVKWPVDMLCARLHPTGKRCFPLTEDHHLQLFVLTLESHLSFSFLTHKMRTVMLTWQGMWRWTDQQSCLHFLDSAFPSCLSKSGSWRICSLQCPASTPSSAQWSRLSRDHEVGQGGHYLWRAQSRWMLLGHLYPDLSPLFLVRRDFHFFLNFEAEDWYDNEPPHRLCQNNSEGLPSLNPVL